MIRNRKVVYRVIMLLAATFLIMLYILRRPSEPPTAPHKGLSDWKPELDCHSCALVGTAGVLIDSHAGSSIDSSSCVFRMGFSPLENNEDDLGYKTTVRVIDSMRFSHYLKDPEKLTKRHVKADKWFIFDAQKTDRENYESLLSDKIDISWITAVEHLEVFTHLKEHAKKQDLTIGGGNHSAFWFLIRIMEKSGCKTYSIFGVPDPKICERERNLEMKAEYWKIRKPEPMCIDGEDWGETKVNNLLPLQSPSLLERQALTEWAKNKEVKFFHPSWPDL